MNVSQFLSRQKSTQANLNNMGAKVDPHKLSYSSSSSSYTSKSSSYSSKSSSSLGNGCSKFPKAPANTKLACSGKTCQLNCMSKHLFPNGADKLTLVCDAAGNWMLNGKVWDQVQSCEREYI